MIESIKKHEGFRGMPYTDSLNFLTIGYGTKLPITKDEAELLLKYRLNQLKIEVNTRLVHLEIPPDKWDILYEMAYQMGVSGLLKFKKMIKALKEKDYQTAGKEMLDSRWAKQTPNRAKELYSQMIK